MDWWESWKDDFDRLPNDVLQIIIYFRRRSKMVLTEERAWLVSEVRQRLERFQMIFLEEVGARHCLQWASCSKAWRARSLEAEANARPQV